MCLPMLDRKKTEKIIHMKPKRGVGGGGNINFFLMTEIALGYLRKFAFEKKRVTNSLYSAGPRAINEPAVFEQLRQGLVKSLFIII